MVGGGAQTWMSTTVKEGRRRTQSNKERGLVCCSSQIPAKNKNSDRSSQFLHKTLPRQTGQHRSPLTPLFLRDYCLDSISIKAVTITKRQQQNVPSWSSVRFFFVLSFFHFTLTLFNPEHTCTSKHTHTHTHTNRHGPERTAVTQTSLPSSFTIPHPRVVTPSSSHSHSHRDQEGDCQPFRSDCQGQSSNERRTMSEMKRLCCNLRT